MSETDRRQIRIRNVFIEGNKVDEETLPSIGLKIRTLIKEAILYNTHNAFIHKTQKKGTIKFRGNYIDSSLISFLPKIGFEIENEFESIEEN